MRHGRKPLYISIFFILFVTSIANAGFGDILKGVSGLLGNNESLKEGDIVAGLKEALEIGTGNAVGVASKVDGYYKNQKIKIPLPSSIQKVEKVLRMTGFGSTVDDFEISMNRAAEKAAPEAKSIFWYAIKQMNFSDAKKILNGRENEATLFFEGKTSNRLQTLFKPIVHAAMGEVGVTRIYQDLDTKARAIPFAEKISFDLDQYVTEKALSGLFFLLAEEEAKIRKDPAARVTDLLKKVFDRGQ